MTDDWINAKIPEWDDADMPERVCVTPTVLAAIDAIGRHTTWIEMARVLDEFPKDHPGYEDVRLVFCIMCEGVMKKKQPNGSSDPFQWSDDEARRGMRYICGNLQTRKRSWWRRLLNHRGKGK